MQPTDVYCKSALETGIDQAKVIDPGSIITAEWVRMKCQYGCPGFGKSLCCPPRSPTPEITRKVIDSYRKAILLHRKLPNGEKSNHFNEAIVNLEIRIFLDGYYKTWSMGSGPCRLCKECNLVSCQNGYRARPSMEACGIDVFQTARGNGFPIEVIKGHGEERNIYGLILIE